MKLTKLNLDIYKCKELRKTVENIQLEWGQRQSKTSDFELKYIIANLIKKSIIKASDILKLFYNLGQVKIILKEKYNLTIEEFFRKLENVIEKEEIQNSFFNLDVFYDSILIFYRNIEVQKIIFSISNKVSKIKDENYSKKTKLFIEMRKNDEKVISFLARKFLEKIDKYLSDLFEYELEYYIDRKSELFYDIIEDIIKNYIGIIVIYKGIETNEIIKENFKRKITNYQNKIEIYKEILNSYSRIGKFNINTDMWFHEILSVIGDIREKNNGWKYFEEKQKNIFARWFFQEKLNEFFGRKVKDYERTEFWKNYAHCLRNIDYYERLSQAIVMEFENHTIIEFGTKGNAAYVYPKSKINSLIIRNWYNNYSSSLIREKIRWQMYGEAIPLKNTNSTRGWNHSSNWQAVFKYRLSELGYKAEGRIW